MRRQPKRRPRKAEADFKKRVTFEVFRDPKDEREFLIKPKEAYVEYGGTVNFTSRGTALIVFFPTPGRPYVPFRPLKKRPFFTVSPRGRQLSVLKPKAQRRGERVYVFAVYCKKLNTFAHASMPRMIVGP